MIFYTLLCVATFLSTWNSGKVIFQIDSSGTGNCWWSAFWLVVVIALLAIGRWLG